MFFEGTNPRSSLESTKASGTNPRFVHFLVKYEPKKSFRMSGARVRTQGFAERTRHLKLVPSDRQRVTSEARCRLFFLADEKCTGGEILMNPMRRGISEL